MAYDEDAPVVADGQDGQEDWAGDVSDLEDDDALTDPLPDAAPRDRGHTVAVPLTRATGALPSVAAMMAQVEALDDGPSAAPATNKLPAVSLIPIHDSLPVIEAPAAPPVVIPGARRLRGVPKHPFIARRQRPLTVGLIAFTIIGALVISGLAIAAPLGEALDVNGGNPLLPQSGAVTSTTGVRYFWYTAHWGDSPQSLAQTFHVTLGGIYELNLLQAGDELLIGRQYKIPLDAEYGSTYQPPSMLNVSANYGNIRFGPNWWNSIAGTPPTGSPCAPDGRASELGYQLQAPNWGSRWVRGFIVYGTWVYHTGVDLAAPQGNVIHAAQAGQVIWAGYDGTNGLGWSVKIDHCNHVSTVYGHMMRILVHAGDFVDVGSPVGLEGSTGNSTGPHLHFMVEWNNLWVNPMLFYPSQAAIINPTQ